MGDPQIVIAFQVIRHQFSVPLVPLSRAMRTKYVIGWVSSTYLLSFVLATTETEWKQVRGDGALNIE